LYIFILWSLVVKLWYICWVQFLGTNLIFGQRVLVWGRSRPYPPGHAPPAPGYLFIHMNTCSALGDIKLCVAECACVPGTLGLARNRVFVS
jgi:hypothetical protein